MEYDKNLYTSLESIAEKYNDLNNQIENSNVDFNQLKEINKAIKHTKPIYEKFLTYKKMIENAVVIKDVKTDKVSIGTTVTIKYVDDDEEEVYSIVGSKEADPFENKISNESPIAKAIIGLSVGDKVTVDSPNGKYDVEIMKIA